MVEHYQNGTIEEAWTFEGGKLTRTQFQYRPSLCIPVNGNVSHGIDNLKEWKATTFEDNDEPFGFNLGHSS